MSEKQDRIDELSRRLERLIQEHTTFSDRINSLKSELQDLKAIETPAPEEVRHEVSEVKPTELTPVSEPEAIEWPSEVDLGPIKKALVVYEDGVTGGGKQFVKFMITRQDITYDVSCAENGNWIVQDREKQLIAKGRFKDEGKTVIVTKGENEGMVISRSSLSNCIAEAAGLEKLAAVTAKERYAEVTRPAPANVEREKAPSTMQEQSSDYGIPVERQKTGLEKFIGENLIAVIAICIILIGVVFGVKYSLDHDLISPLMRIVLSYALGTGILFVGMKLKKKYEQFSAILVSGSMAIMYFVTYAAYSFYGLIPQLPTFGVMVLFTGFTAYTAIHYNRQIIAHIALVGSYAVPFLLSDGSGNVKALFIYMTIVNAGILFIAMKKHWKPLYYVAFGFTWLIYLAWFMQGYDPGTHFSLALFFGAVFFVLFYATFLVYKLIKKEQFAPEDVVMILLNSAVYYGSSYMVLDNDTTGRNYLGLFTIAVAIVHFIVSVILYTTKLADRKLFYLSSGMVLTFLTMAIPVQLDGTWVTLLWALEAAVLFWIGRTKDVKVYEMLSYPVMAIALISLGHDWGIAYSLNKYDIRPLEPFANVTFLTSIIVAVSFGFMNYVNSIQKHRERFLATNPSSFGFLRVVLPLALILIVYNMFRLELSAYWYQRYAATLIELEPEHLFDFHDKMYNEDILRFKDVWTINYTLIFLGILSVLNIKRFKSQVYGIVNILVNCLAVLLFLGVGLFELSELRESYMAQTHVDVYEYSTMAIGLRYVSYALVAGMIFLITRYIRQDFMKIHFKMGVEMFMHATILWVLCAELINILNLVGSQEQHKLGLSILCGLYAFVLVGIGIWKNRQYLRIAAFSLFGMVLVKLFFYDIAHLTTIAKMIVFISLGLILLLISYMYNKFKDRIEHEED